MKRGRNKEAAKEYRKRDEQEDIERACVCSKKEHDHVSLKKTSII